MIITPAEIQTQYWAMSREGIGHIATGGDEVDEALANVLLTVPGSAPLEPAFGSDLYRYISQPLSVAAAGIRNAVREAARVWEPRAEIQSVESESAPDGGLTVRVSYSVAGQSRFLSLPISPGGVVASPGPQIAYVNPETRALARRADWAMTRRGFGQIVQGAAEIAECLYNIFATIPGSAPLEPAFGCDLVRFVGQPLPVAAIGCKAAMRAAVETWERRVVIARIAHEFYAANGDGHFSGIKFSVYWRLRSGAELYETELLFGGDLDGLSDGQNPIVPVVPIRVLGTELSAVILTDTGAAIELE